jgi:translation elongation factor EF-4
MLLNKIDIDNAKYEDVISELADMVRMLQLMDSGKIGHDNPGVEEVIEYIYELANHLELIKRSVSAIIE